MQTDFESRHDVLRGFRDGLTNIARQHIRRSTRLPGAYRARMIKGVEVGAKRHSDQQNIKEAVVQGVSEAMSKLP